MAAKSRMIELPETVLDCIVDLHEKIRSKANTIDPDTEEVPEENSRYYISDRRWSKCMGILRTSACLNGRTALDFSDLLLLSHMLWNDDASIGTVRAMVAEAVMAAVFRMILERFRSPKRHATMQKGKESAFHSPDGRCFLIDCDGSPLKIRKTDYEMMQNDPKGFYFASETTDGTLFFSPEGQFSVTFERKGVLKINGYSYHLQTLTDHELDRSFISETENIFDSTVGELFRTIDRNIFTARTQTFHALQGVTEVYRKRFMQLKGK